MKISDLLFQVKSFKRSNFWIRVCSSVDFGYKVEGKALFLYFGLGYPLRVKARVEIGLPV